jgi:hypothetical protein
MLLWDSLEAQRGEAFEPIDWHRVGPGSHQKKVLSRKGRTWDMGNDS